MRASRTNKAARSALALAAFATLAPLGVGAQESVPLEPAFRLPAGGRAVAGPLVDASSPASAWFISEDGSLYVISESGALSAKIPLRGAASPYLALDPFGRALVLVDGRLEAVTRTGTVAWSRAFASPPTAAPAFGSDGRAFVAAGRELACLNPAGRRLWSAALPAEPSSPPAVDAAGRAALGLADGSLLVLSPYGGAAFTLAVGGGQTARLVAPMAGGPTLPCLAAALSGGGLLLVGESGGVLARLGGQSPFVDLAWDGAVLYALDAAGGLSAISAAGSVLWSADTRCRDGRLALFPERIVAAGKGRAVSYSPEGLAFRGITIANSAGRSAPTPSGILFTPGQDWILAAYRFEAPLGARRSVAPSPYPDLASAAEALSAHAFLYDPLAADMDAHATRLDDIEKQLRSGTIGEGEPAAAAFCAALAAGTFEREYPQAERRFRGDPLARARACAILGELGSPDYRPALARVLSGDSDSAVRDAACDALAAIGVDPGGLSAQAFLTAARAPAEERTALALIAAIERMALRSGTAPGRDAVGTLLALASRPYASSVRGRASAALGRIAGAIADR